MKTLVTLVILAMFCPIIKSQKLIEETRPLKKSQELVLKFEFADNIVFKTWENNEVKVNVSVDINNNEDNDAYTLDVEETPTGNLRFEAEIKNMKKLQKHEQVYDKEGNELYVSNTIDFDVFYEITVPSNAKITLETITGNIEGKGLMGSLDFKTISGDIDITYPVNGKADLDLKTISGEMYTDFDFTKNNEASEYKHHYISSEFEYELNGGGNDVELNTISGNIYFRKQ